MADFTWQPKAAWKKRQEQEASDLRRFRRLELPGIQEQLNNVTVIQQETVAQKMSRSQELRSFIEAVSDGGTCQASGNPQEQKGGGNGTDAVCEMAEGTEFDLYISQRNILWPDTRAAFKSQTSWVKEWRSRLDDRDTGSPEPGPQGVSDLH